MQLLKSVCREVTILVSLLMANHLEIVEEIVYGTLQLLCWKKIKYSLYYQ